MPQIGEHYLHYELLDFLGQGAMGQVFRAKDTRLDREVALKFLLNANLEDHDLKARFVQEAKAVARLDHPHVGALYALEESQEQMFLSMAYYQGQSLAEKLQKSLDLQTSLSIFKDLLTGFQYAHEQGIVHRDIKPANIFITQEGNAKILDFGIARLPNSDLTQLGQVMGTMSYSSPEQIKGEVVDARSDIWSLGVLLFRMLTGELPFEGQLPQLITLIVKENPRPLSQWLDHPVLQNIIERCLAKDKRERFESCDALREAIESIDLSQSATITPIQAQANSRLSHPVSLSHKPQPLTEQSTAYDSKRVVGAVLTLRTFEGRQDKLSELHQSIQDNRLVQVCGPVGRGKTALATQFINEDNHFASIVFVTLRGNDPLAFENIVRLLLQTLPVDKRQQLQALQQNEADLLKALSTLLRTCIAEHKTLIVIDNLEDALEDGMFTEAYASLQAFVAGVLQLEGHACQLLITSREPLDITSLGRDLGGMFDSAEVSLEDGLSIPDSTTLLRQLGDGKSGLQTATDEVLTQVVEQCEGIPLVLTNVAGICKKHRSMTLQRFLDMPSKLNEMRREPAKTLYESLTVDEQAVMQVLSVFGKAVPERAVYFLLPELDTEAILLELETTYAVQFNDEGNTYTYSLRPIDQEYAYAQLTEDERQDLHKKAAAFYRELRIPEKSWKRLEDLQPQLDEFDQFVRAKDYDAACDLLMDIDHDYLMLWGYVSLVRDLHLQLLDRVVDKTLRGNHLDNLGIAYHWLGENKHAIEYHEQALEISRETHNRRGEGGSLNGLGNAYRNLGEVRRAIEYHKQSLEIARETGNRHSESANLHNLGRVYNNPAEVKRAIEYFEQALAISREIGDRRGESHDLQGLGDAYKNLDEVKRAIEYYEQALVLSREIGFRRLEYTLLSDLGDAYSELGEAQRAIEYHEQALAISREIHDRPREGIELCDLGDVYRRNLGEFQRAIEYYEQALAIFRTIGDRSYEGFALIRMGDAYKDLGELRRAIDYCEQALAICREVGNRNVESSLLDWLAVVHKDLGELQRATDYHREGLAIALEIHNRRREGNHLCNLGNVYSDLGEWQKMLACWLNSLIILNEIKTPALKEINQFLAEKRRERADFDVLVHSLFPDGDTILNEATGQNYTFFADAPADMPDRILALIDQYAKDSEENEPHDNPNS